MRYATEWINLRPSHGAHFCKITSVKSPVKAQLRFEGPIIDGSVLVLKSNHRLDTSLQRYVA